MEHLHKALLWLTLDGPMVEVRVPDCAVVEVWAEHAKAWAKRSGVASNEWGYLCDYGDTSVIVRTGT